MNINLILHFVEIVKKHGNPILSLDLDYSDNERMELLIIYTNFTKSFWE